MAFCDCLCDHNRSYEQIGANLGDNAVCRRLPVEMLERLLQSEMENNGGFGR